MNTALKGTAAVVADDFSRKRVAVLALALAFFDALFLGSLGNDSLRGFKVFAADNRFVMVLNEVLFFFAIIAAVVEVLVGVGLLEQCIMWGGTR